MSFTTVSNVMMFLNKESFTTFESNVVSMLIPNIDGVINNYCGTTLLATDYTDKRFNGTGGSVLDLRVYPINSISSVKTQDDATTFTDLTTSVYFNSEDSYLRLDQYADTTTFTSGTDNVWVSFNAGYDDISIPSELTYAASYLTSINFKKITQEWIGASDAQFDKVHVAMDSIELPVLVQRVLDRYRVVSIY